MKIVRNETAVELPAVGTVYFEPLARAGEYWRRVHGRTHSQAFRFEIAGRRYWGEIIRSFDRNAASGERTTLDVELRTDSGRHSRALPATAKIEWRMALKAAFRRALAEFVETNDSPEYVAARARGMAPAPAIPADVETGETGPDWEPTPATRFYAQRGTLFAFGATEAAAYAALQVAERKAAADAAKPVRRDNVEYHAGSAARAAGEPQEACPYLAGGERAARWNLGWQEGTPPEPDCTADAARGLGSQACACNLPRESNPFPSGSVAAEAWDGGFSDELASWKAARRAEIADEYGDAAADEF